MKGKPLTAETVRKIEEMLARGVKVSVVAQALDVCFKTVYDVKSGKIQARMKEKENIDKSTNEQSNLLCSNNKCFAFIDGCKSSRCSILNSIDFGNRKCPFFKTRERMDFEERKTNIRLEELGLRGAGDYDYE